MSSVQNPTYLLAPNWNFRPGGPIALGNIVVDPFKPHRVLSKPKSENPPPTETATDKNWRLHLGTDRNANGSMWAKFLENISFNIGTNHEKSSITDYTMESLDTVYFRNDPSIDEINERVKDQNLRKLMRLDSLLSKPVYMVSGIKIARGFELSTEVSTRHSGNAEASGTVAPEVSVGAKVDVSMGNIRRDGFQSGNDIVFAYQLLKIVPKGWREKILELKEYQSKAAFLGDKYQEEDAEVAVESNYATATDFAEIGRGKAGFAELKLIDEGKEFVCIAFKQK